MSPQANADQTSKDTHPNVVLIVIDDMGFAQLGCYGSDIRTPNIDGLAARGLRYNSFHVTALCSPSRAALLTGRNHHAVGMGSVADQEISFSGHTCRIPKSAATLPRILRDARYNTIGVGKWHLTPASEIHPNGPFDRWPLGMGFERYYGFLHGYTNQWSPDLIIDNSFVEPGSGPNAGYHLTNDLTSQAIKLVQEQMQGKPRKPFFLYFATGAMHFPHQVPGDWIQPYRNQFDEGWDVWRERTFGRQKDDGIVPDYASLTPRPKWIPEWVRLSPGERKVYARMMEAYAGFLTHTDWQIGQLVKFMEENHILDKTLIILLSDNGASGEGGPTGWLRKIGGESVDEMLLDIDEIGGFRGSHHYPWGWAWAGNTPFRFWKLYSWLGGVRVPLIMSWPSGLAEAKTGEVRPQFCHAVDLAPTILDIVGVPFPEVVDGVYQQPVDGRSLRETFEGASVHSPRLIQYFETEGSRAIYHDGWKATTDHVVTTWEVDRTSIEGSHDFEEDRWSLFDLRADFSENIDVSALNRPILKQLIDLWWSEARRNHALPLIDGTKQRVALAEQTQRHKERLRYAYTYIPRGGIVVRTPLVTAGFTVVADFEAGAVDELNGMLAAQGDWNNGWACYFKAGLLFSVLTLGGYAHRIYGTRRVGVGKHQMKLDYLPGRSSNIRDFRSSVDGHEIGSEVVSFDYPKLTAVRISFGHKLYLGYDAGLPVDDRYYPPHEFRGNISRVEFEVVPFRSCANSTSG